MGTKLGTTGTSTPHDSDMAYPPGMELHGSKWRIKKRVPQDLLRKHPDIYPSQFLTLKTDESDRRAAASKAWVWLGTLEEEFLRVRETGSKFKRVLPPGAAEEIIHAAIRTREVFGDYVSVYDFARSIEDGATVPLYYENRTPELQLTNENLNQDIEQLLETAELDEDQEKKLEREFAREYHLITRDDRLEAVAADLVKHFLGRGYRGKAMMVCIDKATAVKMYNKVQAHWKTHLAELKGQLKTATGDTRETLIDKIKVMETTDMAVVVSQSQNEIEDLKAKGLDIVPHRQRMVSENLDDQFKDPDSPLRLVFVCAMWITGFDVPTCSTLYLDKPMRNHTLMQTIARANRVAAGKTAGLIVDYVGIFRNLQDALRIYAKPNQPGQLPIKEKAALVEQLEGLLKEAESFCTALGIDLNGIVATPPAKRLEALQKAMDVILEAGEDKTKAYLLLSGQVARTFKAILPDPEANAHAPTSVLVSYLGAMIKALRPPPDISGVMSDLDSLLDDSIATEGYRIGERPQAALAPACSTVLTTGTRGVLSSAR